MALLTSTSDVAVNVQGYYDRNLLERALPELLHDRFGQVRPIPKNRGTKITFRRYGSLAAATSPLSEGVTPSGSKLSTTDIVATLKEYGDFITISDWVSMVGLDNILMEASDVLGEQAGLTWDTLTRSVLVGGTNVRYANGVAARTDIVTTVQLADIKDVVRTLEGGDAKKIKEMQAASTKVATQGLRASFVGITHTDMRQDYEGLAGFVPVEEYASTKDMLPGEIGEIKGVRVCATTNSKIWADGGGTAVTNGLVYTTANTACDVYSTIILGRNAYGIVPLSKKNIANIVKKMGSAGSADPLDQRATSGWKFAHAAKILNDAFMVRIEHGCTDL